MHSMVLSRGCSYIQYSLNSTQGNSSKFSEGQGEVAYDERQVKGNNFCCPLRWCECQGRSEAESVHSA